MITFGDDGAIAISDELDAHAIAALALAPAMKVGAIGAGHRDYLRWHREHVFLVSRAKDQ